MTFWFGYELHNLLFSFINISTITGIIATGACTIGLVLFLEASKIGLAYSKFYSAMLRPTDRQDCYTDVMFLVENHSPSKCKRYIWLTVELGFYIIQIVLGYVIMLLVMTYNGYLMLSVLLASGVGYFLGGQFLMNLQIKTSKLRLPCQQCSNNQKNSSITSSTEAISESGNEGDQESRCCLRDSDVIAVAETKY